MSHAIIAQINGLNKKYELLLPNRSSMSDEFALFHFDYIHYYKPFSSYILPEMLRHFKNNPQENFNSYEYLIHPKYSQALLEEMTENRKPNSDFLKKLSEDMVTDFNKLLIAYRKMNNGLKDKFIENFIKNRKEAFIMLVNSNPELALKTVASLRCPKLQFYLLNSFDSSFSTRIHDFIQAYCWERVMKILTEYCFYPQHIDPKNYYHQWEGEGQLHIKFCRIIMGNRYEQAKKFLKAKSKYDFKI